MTDNPTNPLKEWWRSRTPEPHELWVIAWDEGGKTVQKVVEVMSRPTYHPSEKESNLKVLTVLVHTEPGNASSAIRIPLDEFVSPAPQEG